MLEFVKANVSSWAEGNLWYDERVPGWALAPVLAVAGAGSVALLFAPASVEPRIPSSTLAPLVVASAVIASAIVTKWMVLDRAKTVPLATAASLWATVAWLGVMPAESAAVWPPFALLFLSPLLVPAVGRGFAMLAWHHRLESTMRENRGVIRALLDGQAREGVLLMRVVAVRASEVDVQVLDGDVSFACVAPKALWTAVGPGRWYLARGVQMAEGGPNRSRTHRIVRVNRLDFLGVTDPREELERETFVPEIVFWLVSLALLLVASAAGAWLLARFAS